MSFFLNDSTEFPLINFGGKFNPFFEIIGKDGVLSPSASFSRASTGMTEITQGVFSQASVNAPRYLWKDGKRGLLIEGAATNICLYSDDMSNAAWTKQNSTINGNEITLTTNAGRVYQTISGLTAGEKYVYSFYAKLGTSSAVAYSVYNESAGSTITGIVQYGTQLNSSTFTRVKVEFTTPAGCTSIRVWCCADSGATGTVFVDRQQLTSKIESSYIPTTNSAATRAADVLSISTSSIGFDMGKGTFVYGVNVIDAGSSNSFFDVNDGSASATLGAYRRQVDGRIIAESVGATAEPSFSSLVNTPFKLALSYNAAGFSIAANNLLATNPNPSVQPSSFSIVKVGLSRYGTGQITGIIFSFYYYPRRFSDSELQAITT